MVKRKKLYVSLFLVCGVVAFGLLLVARHLAESCPGQDTRGSAEIPTGMTTPSFVSAEVVGPTRELPAAEVSAPEENDSERAMRWLSSHSYSEIDDAPDELVPWIALHHAKTTVAKDPAGTFRELQRRQELAPGLTPWSFDMVFKEWYSVASGDALKFLFSQDNRLSKWTFVNERVARDLAPYGASPEIQELVEACGGDAHDDVVADLVMAACNAAAWDSAKELALMTNDEARRMLVLRAIEARRKRAH